VGLGATFAGFLAAAGFADTFFFGASFDDFLAAAGFFEAGLEVFLLDDADLATGISRKM